MKTNHFFQNAALRVAVVVSLLCCVAPMQAEDAGVEITKVEVAALTVVGAKKINPTTVEIELSGGRRMTLDFYSDSIFRLFRDDRGGIVRDPESEPEAQILVDQPRMEVGEVKIVNQDFQVLVSTRDISVSVDRDSARLKVTNLTNGKVSFEDSAPATLDKAETTLSFRENDDEYFFGGGVQNGRFSHKGKVIAIENQNSWTDGGVASPNPFYWSTRGYGILWHTFEPGRYDFGATEPGEVLVSHKTNYLDVFVIIGEGPSELLRGYFQLTGDPVLLPKFGFYLGHLNAYNRDFWTEDEEGVLFEDGKLYKESQEDKGGIKESLNGGEENYQFSARGVIDRYAADDMPLGWLLPNDGYGAGYGQAETLEGNVANLRQLGDYARERGVEIGLWTQSDLHPNPEVDALLQRDLVREVRDAGVRVLKTDVAWVGAGYSFGLNGVADAAQMMTYYGNDSRPFIISLDGWAGTQRYAGVWTGDQTGGKWEYIRFHIPTYIGAGLSGMSNITSDMDGIFGGKDPVINTRDYQWKTFTPMQLNMDGWGANPKYPQALGEPATSINRWYLKMKSELMPYAYSIAEKATYDWPMIRAMFLEDPNAYTLGTATRYQFLYGPSFLVAPIYRDTRMDEEGNDVRNNIYLPEGEWIDFFNGDLIQGGRIINNYESPLWKLPVFVKRGAIIPKAKPHNNVSDIAKDERIYEFYPAPEETLFTEYDDDGFTEAYREHAGVWTLIESKVDANDRARLVVHASEGGFDGFVKEKSTIFQVNLTAEPTGVSAEIDDATVALTEADSLEALDSQENAFFYETAPNLNQFATSDSEFSKVVVTKNPVLHVKIAPVNTSKQNIVVEVDGYRYDPPNRWLVSSGALSAPAVEMSNENTGPYSLTPSWVAVENADYYEIEFDGMIYSTIRELEFLLEDLTPETEYAMKVRAVNSSGTSDWQGLSATTKSDPYEFAIKGIVAKSSAADQGGSRIAKLFDFDMASGWHTKWGKEAVPFEFTMNLKSVNVLDKLQYFPRPEGSNGTLLAGKVFYSLDGADWTEAGEFAWEEDGEMKEFGFAENPTAGYVKFEVTEGVNGFGSGQELYVFKVPGSESYVPGDINQDGKIDENDLTSYSNYTGLRKGDSDFEGYISKGDINRNGMIDAYDISVVATQLDGGAKADDEADPLAGVLKLSTAEDTYDAGDDVEIVVSGKGLVSVNALSFALPYDARDFEFLGVEIPEVDADIEKIEDGEEEVDSKAVNVAAMENLTNDRLHSDGEKVLYPTFVNLGDQMVVEGDEILFVIRLKAKRDVTFGLEPKSGVLVDKALRSVALWVED